MNVTTAACAALLACALAVPAPAAIKTEVVKYDAAGTPLVGYLAYDDAVPGKRPGVLVVHEWWGLNDYARRRAEMLAREGYVALALDMYGEGKTTAHPEDAQAFVTALFGQKGAAKQRFFAAHDLLAANPRVDATRIAAIGYCFGGAVVLGMAEDGADLRGVVSFHAALPQEPVAPGTAVKAKILVCHGADDAFETPQAIATFQENLRAAGADWQFIQYSGAQHSFTDPAADRRGMKGLAYNAAADRRSWQAMKVFFAEIFAAQ